MVDYLIHVYKKGSKPFQTLSALPDEEAIAIMKKLYREGSVFWERFKDPQGYLSFRKQVELNIRKGFIEKGGYPIDEHPIYLILGRPKWMEIVADEITTTTTEIITIPLSIVKAEYVSFTYPDSMVSALLAEEKNPEYYEPDYHGRVFTLSEIVEIINKKGLPGEGWETKMPVHYAHYIEAQVWNHELLMGYSHY